LPDVQIARYERIVVLILYVTIQPKEMRMVSDLTHGYAERIKLSLSTS
jgi:hypothetical protein